MGYGRTSASAQVGSDRVTELIKVGVSTPNVSNPASALIAACQVAGSRTLGLVSPYVTSISDKLRELLQNGGISVSRFGNCNEPVEANLARITA